MKRRGRSGSGVRRLPDEETRQVANMKTLRRVDFRGAVYFITCVTYRRKMILLDDVRLLWDSWKTGDIMAWVILPEHFHMIINCGDRHVSYSMHNFKITYSRKFRDKNNLPGPVWQNRFWDHVIRSQKDFENHLHYIHYNPVKHGLVEDPFLYEYSSLNKYLANGFYDRNWTIEDGVVLKGEYGE
jgi:putative transposase